MRCLFAVVLVVACLVGVGRQAIADDAPATPECDLQCQDDTYYPIGNDGMKAPGEVIVRMCLKTPDTLGDVSVAKSSGRPELDAAAVKMVQRKATRPTQSARQQDAFKPGCRNVKVRFNPPPQQHPAEPDQLVLRVDGVSIEWQRDSRGESPVPVAQCDEHCKGTITYPAGKDGQKAAAHVHLNACFNPEGEVDEVAVTALSRVPRELAEAAQSMVRTLRIAPFTGTGMPPRRCHLVRVAFQPEAGPTP